MNKIKSKFDSKDDQMLATAISIMLFVGILKVISQSALFADGAYFFVYNIQNNNFLLSGGREFSNILGQLPIQMALKSGAIHNNYYLSVALGLGFQFLPIFLFVCSFYILARKSIHSKFLLLSILLNVGFSGSVGQASIGISVAALLFSLLQSDFATNKKGQLVILALALVSSRTYESTAVFIPFLAWYLFRKRDVFKDRGFRFFVPIISSLLIFGFISSLKWIFFPYAGSANRDSILNFMVLWTYPTSMSCILLVFMTLMVSSFKSNYVFLASMVVICIFALSPGLTISLGYEYQTRGFAILVIAIGMGHQIALGDSRFESIGRITLVRNQHLVGTALLIFCTTLNTQMNWNSFLAEFRSTVNASVNEKTKYEKIGLAPRQELNSWAWTNPSLSLVVRDNANSSIIMNPEWYIGWDPRVEDEGLPKSFIWRE